jgi:glutathione S-transferase
VKLYDTARAPNPRRVRMYLAEKGIPIQLVPVDLVRMEHRAPAFAAINPLQHTPALELDDGTVLTESIAICRYFEELRPEPPLFGIGALDRAQVEMWQRRLEFGLLGPAAFVFRHLHPAMTEMEAQVPQWGESNKPRLIEFLRFLDRHLASREFVCGDRFTVADITGLVGLDFMKPSRIAIPDDLAHVRRWHAKLSARPSAQA